MINKKVDQQQSLLIMAEKNQQSQYKALNYAMLREAFHSQQSFTTRDILSKKTGHIFVLNIRISFIHSGAMLSMVPNDNTRYSNSSSPCEFFIHVRLKE